MLAGSFTACKEKKNYLPSRLEMTGNYAGPYGKNLLA